MKEPGPVILPWTVPIELKILIQIFQLYHDFHISKLEMINFSANLWQIRENLIAATERRGYNTKVERFNVQGSRLKNPN